MPRADHGQSPVALAALEVSSIARGVSVADALAKRAEIRLLQAHPVTPGKYVLVFTGTEADVLESTEAGKAVAADSLLAVLYLPHAHEAIVPALSGFVPPPLEGALGVLELATISATLLAADRALKAAEVRLCALHLARGIGGKGYVAFSGAQHAVEAALEAGDEAVDPVQRAGRELIARPHPDLEWVVGRLTL